MRQGKRTHLGTLDLLVGLRQLYEALGEGAVKDLALALIPLETAETFRKKYAAVWRGA